jgi:hypothetical protein
MNRGNVEIGRIIINLTINTLIMETTVLSCAQFPLIDVDAALVLILDNVDTLPTTTYPLIESCGSIVSENICAKGILILITHLILFS